MQVLLFILLLLQVARKFDVLPDALIELFLICTPMGDSVGAKRVYRKRLVMLPNRITLGDFVELEMFDFDIILGRDCLHACFASIDFKTRVVKFQLLNEPILE